MKAQHARGNQKNYRINNEHASGTIAAGEQVIQSSTFYNNTASRVTNIVSCAFSRLKITQLFMHKGILRLEDTSFNECKQLEEISLPESIALIRSYHQTIT